MKKIIIAISVLMSLLCCFSCKKTKSLSELRREERKSIENFIKDNHIEVLNEFPADTVFADNQYYLAEDGLYIQVLEKGTGGTPQKGDEIVTNYYEITMAGDTITSMWSASDYGYSAPSFTLDTDYTMPGFNSAAKYLQTKGEANLIVPSKLGFSSAQTAVIAYRYRIRIKIKG